MTQCTATPGCPGTVEDGYCNHCGMAAVPAPAPAGHSPTQGVSRASASVPSARTGSQGILSTRSGPSRRTGSTRTGSTGAAGGRRGMLGVGLVEVPPVPYRDPASAIMTNPEVAERKRFCSSCGEQVGRSRNGREGRTEGFCPKCGTAFSFTPKLQQGSLVAGQYEVLGCLAHGGLGWIYLARDKFVNDRWIVLKGLLDTGDAEALAAAAAEMAFLAEVEHPNIVKIINFVQHPEPKTGKMVGYIVMEYVGGQSLKDVLVQYRKAQNSNDASLPLPQVLAYGIEVLRAFGYLHGKGLLYCDFKPDNAIQSEEQLKLLDLGGVRRIDDDVSPIYGTAGFQGPEVPAEGPSISSDLYTVGRTLAVLSFAFRFTSTFETSLPTRQDVKVLSDFESYDRFLRRACHENAEDRFQDAAEMAEQLTGVLREVLSLTDGSTHAADSVLFGPERTTVGADLAALTAEAAAATGPNATPIGTLDQRAAALALPVPLVWGTDKAAGFLAGLTIREPQALAAALESAPVQSPEVDFMLARVRIELGDFRGADTLLEKLLRTHSGDWRVDWYRALSALAAGEFGNARALFEGLYTWMPGEVAPKLGLAFACELIGDLRAAAQRYDAVWRTDHGYVSAAFGLARVLLAGGDRSSAVSVLNSVPDISSRYVAAQVAAVAAAVRARDPHGVGEHELSGAGQRLLRLRLDKEQEGRLSAEVLQAGLAWVLAGQQPQQRTLLLEAPFVETNLREKLEETYRDLARLARDPGQRHTLVLRANAVRPRTLI